MKYQFRLIFGTQKSAEISEIHRNFSDINPIQNLKLGSRFRVGHMNFPTFQLKLKCRLTFRTLNTYYKHVNFFFEISNLF